MKTYKSKFQHEWMATDQKPKGRVLKKIQSSIRQSGKKEIQRQLDDAKDTVEDMQCDAWCKHCV